MAVAKIKAIRGSDGIKRSAKYVENEEKTITTVGDASKSANEAARSDNEILDKIQDDFLNGSEESSGLFGESDEPVKTGIGAVVDYAMNPDKTEDEEVKLVSGHNCNPLTAAEEMQFLVDYWKKERRMWDNDKDAYHLIQSFDPKDNYKLTYEEAHKIGLEMCKEIEKISQRELKGERHYKMLVCTHIDKKHIHNHILFCPYDIETGYKYHDNKITYKMVREANDKLCKAHDLSIVLNPDDERKRSYTEEMAKKAGRSWKDDIRKDIEAMKSVCNDWETFVSYMEASGYTVKQGKYTTYTDSEGHSVRDKTLGRDWTKEEIQKYWDEMNKEQDPVTPQKESYYSDPHKVNSKTKKPYKVRMYDEDGRRRSSLEVILLLALNIISNEGDNFNVRNYSSDNPMYAKKDYKLQQMMDTLTMARIEKVNSIEDISNKLNEAGKNLSHYKLELKKNNATLNKMESIRAAIEGYQKVRGIVEMINGLEEGPAKEAIKEEHKAEIDEYKKNKAILYKSKCATDEQIADFDNRFETVKNNISVLESKIKVESSEYAKLKRLQDNVELAQNKQYLYGPEYEIEPREEREPEEPTKSSQGKDR